MTKKQHQYLLVYGSLRKQEYNYYAFKSLFKDELQYINTGIINGYDMYSLGTFPAIIAGEGSIVVDLIKCSYECYNDILNMELNANYREETVLYNKKMCKLFIYNDSNLANKIPEGDWTKFRNG